MERPIDKNKMMWEYTLELSDYADHLEAENERLMDVIKMAIPWMKTLDNMVNYALLPNDIGIAETALKECYCSEINARNCPRHQGGE
jgi:hypothetical protein